MDVFNAVLNQIQYKNFSNQERVVRELNFLKNQTVDPVLTIVPVQGYPSKYSACFQGLVRVNIKNIDYFFPVIFQFPWNYPQIKPSITVQPIETMEISTKNPNVNPKTGEVFFDSLTHWNAYSQFEAVFNEMIEIFRKKSPLFLKQSGQPSNQPKQIQPVPQPQPKPIDPIPAPFQVPPPPKIDSDSVQMEYSQLPSQGITFHDEMVNKLGEMVNDDLSFIVSEKNKDIEQLNNLLGPAKTQLEELNKALADFQRENDEIQSCSLKLQEVINQAQLWLRDNPEPPKVDVNQDVLKRATDQMDGLILQKLDLQSQIDAFAAVENLIFSSRFDETTFDNKMREFRILAKQHLKDKRDLAAFYQNFPQLRNN
ncbi:MAG: hypothetical protein EZS28_019201 [Streblomastix strix]|uniref:UEV domain-containing protein n=1 Tax=Streblomastix strix TaxID=222440 RepID=A0A5J4VRP9_9EUKA|nr:MAG: hypothetical protein EZS28_019201 [Streblomastix strix]